MRKSGEKVWGPLTAGRCRYVYEQWPKRQRARKWQWRKRGLSLSYVSSLHLFSLLLWRKMRSLLCQAHFRYRPDVAIMRYKQKRESLQVAGIRDFPKMYLFVRIKSFVGNTVLIFLASFHGLAMNQIAVNLSRRNWSKNGPKKRPRSLSRSATPKIAPRQQLLFCGIYKEICLCHLLIFLASQFLFSLLFFSLIGPSLLICAVICGYVLRRNTLSQGQRVFFRLLA